MKRYRNNNKSRKDRRERISFFTAFSVCIIAIGLAIGSTYASIGGLEGNLRGNSASGYSAGGGSSTEAVDNEVQGIILSGKAEETSEATATEVVTTEATTVAVTEAEVTETTFADVNADPDEDDKLQTILQISSSLLYPVASERVQKEYSEQAVSSKTMDDYRPHTGTDFAADAGEAVFSVCDGIVDDVAKDDMYGNILKVTNGIYSVYYCGVGDDIAVNEGDAVTAGQVIAQVGEIPCESEDEPHLHLEVRVSGNSIDPMTVISNNE